MQSIWQVLRPILRPGVLREGRAARVIFYFPLDEGTYLDQAWVTLYRNGLVHIQHDQEEVTAHAQNVEIVWANRRLAGVTGPGKSFKLLKMPEGHRPQRNPLN